MASLFLTTLRGFIALVAGNVDEFGAELSVTKRNKSGGKCSKGTYYNGSQQKVQLVGGFTFVTYGEGFNIGNGFLETVLDTGKRNLTYFVPHFKT